MTRLEQDRQYPTALNYLTVIIRWRGFIIKSVLVSTFMMAVYSLIMPKTYESRAVIVPTSNESSLDVYEAISGGLLSFGMGRSSTEILLLKAILESRTLKESIIIQFGLDEIYKTRNMEEAVRILADRITITITNDYTLVVSFNHQTKWFTSNRAKEDSVKSFVQRVATAVVRQMDLLNRQYQGQEARNYRRFIEERRDEIGRDLAALEDELVRYQKKHNVTIVDAQLIATYEAAAILEAEIVKQELEYAMAVAKLGSNNPVIKSLQIELQAAKSAFQKSLGGRGNEKRFLLGYDRDLPALMKEYLQFSRDISIQSEIFTFITTRYEEARLRESQDIPTINILDYPDTPDIRSAPRRAFMVMTTGVLMTIFAVIIAFVLDFFHRTRVEYPEQYRELTQWKKRNT